MKKLVPDPPVTLPCARRNPEHDRANDTILQALCLHRPEGSFLDGLKPTAARAVGADSLFGVRGGISAEEALVHVSILLKAAEEVSDEITARASGVERGLIWSMIHSVEMARGVVDALLDGGRPPSQR